MIMVAIEIRRFVFDVGPAADTVFVVVDVHATRGKDGDVYITLGADVDKVESTNQVAADSVQLVDFAPSTAGVGSTVHDMGRLELFQLIGDCSRVISLDRRGRDRLVLLFE